MIPVCIELSFALSELPFVSGDCGNAPWWGDASLGLFSQDALPRVFAGGPGGEWGESSWTVNRHRYVLRDPGEAGPRCLNGKALRVGVPIVPERRVERRSFLV